MLHLRKAKANTTALPSFPSPAAEQLPQEQNLMLIATVHPPFMSPKFSCRLWGAANLVLVFIWFLFPLFQVSVEIRGCLLLLKWTLFFCGLLVLPHSLASVSCVVVALSCPALCDPKDCSPPGSSVHGILQTSILEWVASSFSRGSSQCRDQTRVSQIAGRSFTVWASREASLALVS